MGHKKNVQRLYHLFRAGWYDPFRKLWTSLVSEKAERRLVRMLRKAVRKDSRILDLGCGTGINASRLKDMEFASYTGVDLTEDMLTRAIQKHGKDPRMTFLRKDITEPIDGTYDIIISTWVLSHIYRPSKVINRIHDDNLAEGGTMLLIFLSKPKWYIHFWFYPFFRLFAAKIVPKEEIDRMSGAKDTNEYAHGTTTLVRIRT